MPNSLYAQSFSGQIKDLETKENIEFVEIGIKQKIFSTISNIDGKYSLNLNNIRLKDSLIFYHPKYETKKIKVKDYIDLVNKDIELKNKAQGLDIVRVNKNSFEEKTIGNNFYGKKYQGGFIQNTIGFECGVLLDIKKKAILNKLYINVTDCAYDKVYFRLNVYKETGKNKFKNILTEAIYIEQKLPKNTECELEFDLRDYFIHVDGSTLITIQQVSNLGKGQFLISGGTFSGDNSYYRTSSFGKWIKAPIKLSFRVDALVEK